MSNSKYKLLLVEDDPYIARVIQDHLRNQYEITWASTGREGWEDFQASSFDLALIDFMLPEMDGITLANRIRQSKEIPILIISARHEDEHKIRGLGLGADDYITKPFSLEVLTAKIVSHIRRYHRYQQPDLAPEKMLWKYAGDLVLDWSTERIFRQDTEISLTSKERHLLFHLAKHPFQSFSKEELLDWIWNQESSDAHTVTVHMRSLRKKLQDPVKKPLYLETLWGIGYRFIGERLS